VAAVISPHAAPMGPKQIAASKIIRLQPEANGLTRRIPVSLECGGEWLQIAGTSSCNASLPWRARIAVLKALPAFAGTQKITTNEQFSSSAYVTYTIIPSHKMKKHEPKDSRLIIP
jgi:hypothetical protein